MKKMIALFISCMAITVVLLSGVTVTYFTDNQGENRDIKVGKVDIAVEEPNYKEQSQISLGVNYPKDPQIKNNTNTPCYVRAKIIYNNDLDISFNGFNSSKWSSKQSDGYYYYKDILDGYKITEKLFTSIILNDIPKDLTSMDINIYAEAVQTKGSNNSLSIIKKQFENIMAL